jgi:hypothetical protein
MFGTAFYLFYGAGGRASCAGILPNAGRGGAAVGKIYRQDPAFLCGLAAGEHPGRLFTIVDSHLG